MNRLLQDLRYALRQLRKNPGFTATVVITLALGIGANTAIFCVVNALLLRVLPYRDASHLVYVAERWPHEPMVPGPPSPDFIAWRTRGKTFEQIEAYSHGAGSTLTGIGEPERVEPTNITSGFLDMLGVRLALGRNFSGEEDRPNGPPVVILGHKFWQDHFVSTADVIGKSIELDGKASTIIGVLPASFVFPDNNFSSDLLVPLKLDPTPGWNERTFRLLRVMGRPKPRVSAEAMQQEFASIVQSNAAQEPPQFITMRKDMQVTVTPLRQWLSGEVRPLLLILQAVVAMVLLIACLNVASLQIGRAVSRQKEVAVRSSLGATRRRIAGQLFTETLLLSLLGGAAGVGLGTWGLSYLRAFLPENLHLVKTAHIDLTVLAFTMILAIVSGAVTGLAPVGAAYRVNPNEILKEGGGRSPTAGHRRLREVLIIAEVAVAMILFAGAGLLVRSFIHLRTAEVGFDPRNVLTAHLQLSGRKYPTGESETRFLSQILEHAQALPGVQDAAIASGLPLIGSMSTVGAVVEEKPAPPPGGAPDIPLAQVSASYFHILAIPLIRGRLVSEEDREGTPLVVVINQSFAQRFFPGEEAIGKHVKFGSVSKGPWYEIVGIVGNVRQEHLRSEDSPNLYVPYRQYLSGNVFLIFKSTRPDLVSGSQIAKLVHALDPEQPLDDIATMETRLADSITADRANMELMGIFAGVALALAAIGIFGVIAYFVSRRTHEIGVRMALGAQRRDVLWLVLRPGMVATTIGIGIGLIGAFASTRVLRSSLYGVSPNDPLTLAAVSVVFFFVAFSACYIPARRAANVDPMVALRYE